MPNSDNFSQIAKPTAQMEYNNIAEKIAPIKAAVKIMVDQAISSARFNTAKKGAAAGKVYYALVDAEKSFATSITALQDTFLLLAKINILLGGPNGPPMADGKATAAILPAAKMAAEALEGMLAVFQKLNQD